MDRWRLDGGLGIEAKMPNGPWGLDEHITIGSSDIAWSKDPWISTTEDIQIVRKFYKKEQLGIVEIDLDKVPNLKVKGWEVYPDEGPFSAHGLSKTQQEITTLILFFQVTSQPFIHGSERKKVLSIPTFLIFNCTENREWLSLRLE